MFGYIRTDTPELRVRENEYYRAVYCGLCRAQGKCTGQCSRMTLSYDMVFLALLRLAVSDEKIEFKRGRCMVHPFKKRTYLSFSAPLAYCAYAMALLTYGKVKDDLADEKGMAGLKAKLLLPIAKGMKKRVPDSFASLEKVIEEKMTELSKLEAEAPPSVDAPADLFGDILSEIAAFGLDGNDAMILRKIGKHIGRWIYIVDAADDLKEDLEKGRFNPFSCLYGGKLLDDNARQSVSYSLRLELMQAEPAFDLLDLTEKGDIEGIVKNIIYSGMPDVADRVLELNGKSCHNKKKRKDDL